MLVCAANTGMALLECKFQLINLISCSNGTANGDGGKQTLYFMHVANAWKIISDFCNEMKRVRVSNES